MSQGQQNRTTVVSMLQIGFPCNTECADMDGFPWPGYMLKHSHEYFTWNKAWGHAQSALFCIKHNQHNALTTYILNNFEKCFDINIFGGLLQLKLIYMWVIIACELTSQYVFSNSKTC